VMTSAPTLLMIILAAGVLTCCSRGDESTAPITQTSAPAAQPATLPPAATPTAATLPPAGGISQGLTRSNVPATGFLDTVGSVNNASSQKSIRVAGDKELLFSGWAIDRPRRSLAGGVEVAIDGTPYIAQYGDERPDVAQHLKNPAMQQSGFQLTLPPQYLSKGTHSATLRVIAMDKKSYYVGPTIRFTVE
jgi:hypothetical protein